MNVSVLVSITRVSAPFPRRSDASSSPVLRLSSDSNTAQRKEEISKMNRRNLMVWR